MSYQWRNLHKSAKKGAIDTYQNEFDFSAGNFVKSLSHGQFREQSMTSFLEKKCPECQQVFPRKTHICPDDGSQLAITVPSSPFTHKLTPRYELISEIGRGGMGVIYKGVDHEAQESNKRHVAIKLLLAEAGENSTVRNRFINEARAASALNHPNIVRVSEYAVSDEGLPYMVMEYLEGMPLSHLIDTGNLDREVMLRALIDVCDALAHAHWRNIVHRDIKPSNIMMIDEVMAENGNLTKTFRAVLVDFGIAKIFTQPGQLSMRLTRTGEVFGSPLYMSPEQCMGQKIDFRSDIYSLGCLLYECVTGRPPFDGESFIQVVFQHINAEPEAFAADAFETVLESVIMKAMSKNPDDRYASVTELKYQLEYCLALLTDGAVANFADFQALQGVGGKDEDLLALEEEANNGDANAQLQLAFVYQDPTSRAYSPELAFSWCLKAATEGLTEAQALLGDFFFDGVGTAADMAMALYWLTKAALAEHSGAERVLGRMYLEGLGVEVDKEKALDWLRRSSQRGDLESCYLLAYQLHTGEILDQDLEEAVQLYQVAAELGMADAQAALANCLLAGTGCEQDMELAVYWYTCAAEQGLKEAQRELAECYFYGNGVDVDEAQALAWMKKAAEAGDSGALTWMGYWYGLGYSTLPVDHQRANKFLREAAEQDNAKAMYYLGYNYRTGTGVKEDYKAARLWFSRAVEAGDCEAKYELSVLYRDGLGGARDNSESLRLLREAAEDGVVDAQAELAIVELDKGNKQEARKWLELAVAQGSEESEIDLAALDEED